MSVFVLEDEGASTPGNPLRLRFDNTGDTDVDFEVDDAGQLNIRGSSPDGIVMNLFEPAATGVQFTLFQVYPTGTAFIAGHTNIFPSVSNQPVGSLSDNGRIGGGVHTNSPGAFRTPVGGGTSPSLRAINAETSGTRETLTLEYAEVVNDEVSAFWIADDGGGLRAQCWTNGDIENANNNYSGFSDENFKQDIIDADPQSQWDDLKAMRFRKFRWIADVEHRGDDALTCLGCVGQEMQAVSPGLVRTSTRRKEVTESIVEVDGQMHTVSNTEYFNDGPPVLSVKYSILYMKGMVALQEAMRRIEVLEAAIA